MNNIRRTIITTCGISLYESCCWEYHSLLKKEIQHYVDCNDEYEIMELKRDCKKLLSKKDNPIEVSVEFKDKYWNELKYIRDFPAELASLHAIEIFLRDIVKKPFNSHDKIILLHSCSKEGQFCADVLHAILINYDLLQTFNKNNIDKYPVTDLDPSNFKTFGKGLRKIWDNYIDKSSRNDTEYFFNLTGGFKATAILLGAVAFRNYQVTNIFYLHEDTKSPEICRIGFNAIKGSTNKYLYTEFYNIETKKYTQNGLPDRETKGFS